MASYIGYFFEDIVVQKVASACAENPQNKAESIP